MKNAILLLSALTMSLPTFATQEQTHQSYLYLGTGNVGFDTPEFGSDRDSGWSTPHITIGWGYNVNQYLAFEGVLRYSQNELKNDSLKTDLDLHYYQAGMSAVLTSDNLGDTPLSLFGRVTALGTQAEMYIPDVQKVTDNSGALFNVGAGIHWDMSKDIWLRAEYIYNVADMGFDNFYDSYEGVQVSLGKRF
ncbi:porin family protein [Vibrio harveyi]|uniref:porin family protein n=1 Tax=Vibrio harveyi TaxID=669 RepID=UPI003BB64441